MPFETQLYARCNSCGYTDAIEEFLLGRVQWVCPKCGSYYTVEELPTVKTMFNSQAISPHKVTAVNASAEADPGIMRPKMLVRTF